MATTINVDLVTQRRTYEDRSVNNTQPTNSLDSEIRVHDTEPGILGCHCGSPNGMIQWLDGNRRQSRRRFSIELKRLHNVV